MTRAAFLGLPHTLRANDIGLLIGALGGNAVVPAFYDVRRGVTATTTVSNWDDARGASGFAPALTAAGAAQPSWNGTTQLITFDGSANVMATAASALFDLAAAYSIILVGAIPSSGGSAGVPLGIADSASLNRFLLVRNSTTAGGTIMVQGLGGGTADSAVVVGATRRLSIASKNATTTVAINVANATQATTVVTANGAGNNILTLGKVFAGSGNPSPCVVRAVLTMTRQPTASDLTALFTWSAAYHGVVAA